MAAAVFRAKFTVPSLPADYRARPRLDALWQRCRGARLVTVTAPAGWGKTCFLAGQARARGRDVLWYTLDDLDRDPAVLAAHLAAAGALAPRDAPPLEQLASLVGALDRRRLLVLDDVQAIAQAETACDFLGRLLRYLPDRCQLVIASREPIALADARLDTRGEAARVTAADLAFTPAETAAFLAQRPGGGADASLVARVQALTEGWPAGLEIVRQALGESLGDGRHEVLQRLECGGGRWFEFFAEEVLADLDPRARDFLLRTSVLPHLEPALCDALLGRRDAAATLADLAGRGLFLTRLGDSGWRCHNLLRACLRRQLERDLPARERRRLRRAAATLLTRAGETEAAALDLARAGDPDGACALLARDAVALCGSRRPETLALCLGELPEPLVRRQPGILLVRASLAQLQGRWDQAERDLARALRAGPSAAVAGTIRAHQVRLLLQRGHFAACLRAGRGVLAARPAPAAGDRGVILSSLGVAAASLGRIDEGARHLAQALALARRRRDRALQGRCLFLLAANVHFLRGDFALALAAAREARAIFHELGRHDLACHAEGVLGFVLAGHGDLAEARQSSLWSLQRAEAIGYRVIAGYARLNLGECELLDGDAAAAAVRFGEACGIARELGEEALETWSHLGLAESAWRLGDRARAAAAAKASLTLAARRHDDFCRARALLQLGRLAADDDRARARTHWRGAERILERLGARLELARLALWRAAAGEVDPAFTLADIAASPQAYLLDRLEPALAADLRARGAGGAVHPDAPDGGTRAVVPLHVRALGPLEIARGPAPLAADAWRSRRARRLLNLLIARRCRPVARDQVLEALWPAGDPARTAGNLRQAVFHLRAVLETAGGGEPAHVRSDGETLRLDLGPGGTCDLLDFETALERAAGARREGRSAAETAALQAAVALWRGPFLADTPYEPEVEETAATIRQRFLRAAERLLDLHAARGGWDDLVHLARLALAEDPLHEPFARHLLTGLLRLGHRGEARATYARFEARLVRELDLLPSARLKELAEQAAGPGA